jgi:hypothetical protein
VLARLRKGFLVVRLLAKGRDGEPFLFDPSDAICTRYRSPTRGLEINLLIIGLEGPDKGRCFIELKCDCGWEPDVPLHELTILQASEFLARYGFQLPEMPRELLDAVAQQSKGPRSADGNEEFSPIGRESRGDVLRTEDVDVWLASSDIATQFELPLDALRRRLDRWRKKNAAGSGWKEVSDRSKNEPKYLYLLAAVRSIIDEMRKR